MFSIKAAVPTYFFHMHTATRRSLKTALKWSLIIHAINLNERKEQQENILQATIQFIRWKIAPGEY